MRLAPAPPVPDDRKPFTDGTLPGQTFGVVFAGLHPVTEHGIKTITASEDNAPESLPAKATDSEAAPSLLSIRI
jgi:hypothetical protein